MEGQVRCHVTPRSDPHSPFMHPGNLALNAFSKSSSDIQRPSWLGPVLGMGTVSLCSWVMITVLLSILATSLGSVRANQLQKPHSAGRHEERTTLLVIRPFLCPAGGTATVQIAKPAGPAPGSHQTRAAPEHRDCPSFLSGINFAKSFCRRIPLIVRATL